MPLEKYEVEVLVRLYDRGLISYHYKAIEMVERMIDWSQISNEFGVQEKFRSVKRKLLNKGLVYDAGKSCKVVSISKHGIALLHGLEKA